MKASTLFAATLIIATLGGCAAPINRPVTINKIAVDLQLNATDLSNLSRCEAAKAAPGDKLAVFVPCLYLATRRGALLVVQDPDKQTYHTLRTLDASTIKAVAYKEMGRAKQIQVHGSTDFVVFSLLSDSEVWPANKEARAAFDHLLSLGIAVTEPTTMVMEYLPMKIQTY